MMVLGIGLFVLAFFLWKKESPGLVAVIVVGAISISSGWGLRMVDRTSCITCARCGWRGTKRRWRREGCCPACGGYLHWR